MIRMRLLGDSPLTESRLYDNGEVIARIERVDVDTDACRAYIVNEGYSWLYADRVDAIAGVIAALGIIYEDEIVIADGADNENVQREYQAIRAALRGVDDVLRDRVIRAYEQYYDELHPGTGDYGFSVDTQVQGNDVVGATIMVGSREQLDDEGEPYNYTRVRVNRDDADTEYEHRYITPSDDPYNPMVHKSTIVTGKPLY